MSTAAPQVINRAETPYLDRQRPLPAPNRSYSKIKPWQIPLLLACLLVKTIAVFYALWILVILTHELGHLLIGLAVRDRFDFIRVSSIRIDRSGDMKWEWQWGSLFSGQTHTLPTSRRGQRWRLFLSTLAGPASNVASGFLAFKFASTFTPGSNVLVSASLYVFSAQSFLVAFMNLVPAVLHGRMNDGMRLCTFAFSRKKSERLISILLFIAGGKEGSRESLDKYEIGKWASVNDRTHDQVMANCAAYRKEDNANVEVAAQYLDNCLAHCSATTPEFREELIIEAAKFQALRRNRVDMARAWLAEDTSGKKRLNRYFAEAVILHQEGQIAQVLVKVDEALDYIAATPDSPLRAKQEKAFKKWRIELEEKPVIKDAGNGSEMS